VVAGGNWGGIHSEACRTEPSVNNCGTYTSGGMAVDTVGSTPETADGRRWGRYTAASITGQTPRSELAGVAVLNYGGNVTIGAPYRHCDASIYKGLPKTKQHRSG
jgi:hypothetical protein